MASSKPHIAPLKVVKGLSLSTANLSHSSQITPPPTPMEPSPYVFHNYLRAFYPFHPSDDVSPDTVTLPLEQGDIILVHSVHTNGWADGTLLDTAARGWLPTNYCEAYDQLPMQPLLQALTDFWDIIRGGNPSTYFGNQDLVRGLIAGVRFLLEKSECLTRDSPLMQRYASLRRTRKALLMDLSSLVNTAKKFHEDASKDVPLADDDLEYTLDSMLLKAFKIITRGVRFLDVWNEEVGLSRTIAALEHCGAYEAPLTPLSETPTTTIQSAVSPDERNESRLLHSRLDTSRASMRTDPLDNNSQPSRSVSVQTKRISTSHRVSCSGPSGAVRNHNLASEQLNSAYDAFLGVLGSFIGLHMHPRSSTELAVTTQMSVQSCRALILVVQAVCDRDFQQHCEHLEEAKETMFQRLAQLVHAAGEAFRPANATDDDIAFTPDAGKRLVEAATDCVRGAGNCLAKARQVLECVGDFELDPLSQDEDPADAQTPQPPRTANNNADHNNNNNNLLAIPDEQTRPLPPLPADEDVGPVEPADEPTEPSTPSASEPTVDQASPVPVCSPATDKSLRRQVTSTGSIETFDSDLGDSKTSALSLTSTRATTPDNNNNNSRSSSPPPPPPPLETPSLKPSASQSTLGDEYHEAEADILQKTYAHELIFREGNVVGGSLRALIEKLTAHESRPDSMYVSAFYLTFRLFTTPLEFAKGLVDRFDYIGDTPHAAGPVRLRVSNAFKNWLESHWRHECDRVALDYIIDFAQSKLSQHLPTAAKRLRELAEKVSMVRGPVVPRLVSSMGKTNTAIAQYVHPDTPLPIPAIGKRELNLLRLWRNGEAKPSVLDFDPLELARQFTLKESRIFCSILPEELLASEWMKKMNSLAVNVRAMSTLSTDLAHLVADSILELEEPKRRAAVVKHWIKIANRCLELNNYDSLMAIICSLNSSTIARLRRTWELVPHKHKSILKHLRGVVDVSRNYAVLRQRLHNHVPPCLPFVGTYLTDLTFVDQGNQPVRNLCKGDAQMEVINFDKYMKTAKIISEFQRFQIPYRLAEVSELQTWLQDEMIRVRSSSEMQTFYRRSLVLEPREPATPPAETTPPLESHRFDFFAWTHPKTKSITSQG